MFAQCAYVATACECVYLFCVCVCCVCLYVYAYSCKESQKDSTRTRSDKRVVVVHATWRRKCILSLDAINTEASKLEEGVGV